MQMNCGGQGKENETRRKGGGKKGGKGEGREKAMGERAVKSGGEVLSPFEMELIVSI